MVLAWYSVKTASSSRAAILVFNKYVKEVFDPRYVHPTPKSFYAPLEKEEKRWLLKQVDGFRFYSISESFVLAMQKDYDLVIPPILEVIGPYEIEDACIRVDMDSILAPDDEEYQALLDVARKLTPVAKRVASPPARYHFVAPLAYQLPICEITLEEIDKKPIEAETQDIVPPVNIPLDFEIVVGEGEKKESFKLNKAIIACYFPKLETLIGDLSKKDHFEFPEFRADHVGYVIEAYSTRPEDKLKTPWWNFPGQTLESVKETFGVAKGRKLSKKQNTAHADETLPEVLTNPRWLDVTFVVGPKKEELKANRAVLASRNQILAHTLYGTSSNPVDMDQPIEWPQFDTEAVRKVFLALIRCRDAETTIPLELVQSTKAVVEYLKESPESLNLYYATPFERKFEGSFRLDYDDYEYWSCLVEEGFSLVLHGEDEEDD